MNVLRKVKVDGAWKFLPVRRQGDGYDWSQVVEAGKPRVAAEGTYYLEWRERGKRVRRAVGDHPHKAKRALAAQTKVVSLRSAGIEAADAPIIAARQRMEGKSIAEVIADWKKSAPLKYRVRSLKKYTNALDSFAAWSKKTHLCELGREELIAYMGHLVAKEHLDRSTAVDKGHVVYTVMNQQGADIRMKRGDWPKVTERERGMYETAELDKLFAAADEWEFAVFQTFLLSGMRDQEVGFLAWEDYNARRATLRVSEKPALGFAPKNYQERTVPIPSSLVLILDDHRKREAEKRRTGIVTAEPYLIFGTSEMRKYRGCPGGQRDRHMLDKLKALAERAGLNCGRCHGTWNGRPATCADRPICKHWGLHKFRHTYATNMLRGGVDLVSLQALLGHSDLDSTRKYLKALAPEDLHAKIALTGLATHVFSRAAAPVVTLSP